MADLDDTSESLKEDQKFLADMQKDCKTKKDEWATRSKMRTAELLAIADTIKILNDDDALDLFKEASGEGQSSEEAGECRPEEELRWRACQDS